MTFTEWITTGKDLLLGLAAITTAVVALVGLSKWRQELHEKTGFDAARALTRATYKLRDELQICRSPLISAVEFPENYNRLENRSNEEEMRAWAHVYKNRWAPLWSARQDFDSHTLEAEVLWGPGIRTKTDALRKCVQELYGAIDAVINDKAVGGENFESDKDFGKSMRAIVAAAPDDDTNELNLKIADAINGIEKEVRPHLRRS